MKYPLLSIIAIMTLAMAVVLWHATAQESGATVKLKEPLGPRGSVSFQI